MNPDTGQVYRTPEEIAAAQARGEPLVEISERVAQMLDAGRVAINRHERRKAAALARKAKDSAS